MKKMLSLLVLIMVLSQIACVYARDKPHFPPDFKPRFNTTDPEALEQFERTLEAYINARIIITSLNAVLYGYLTYFYIQLYRENESKFSLGLTALSIVLFVYSATSNPYLLQFIGRPGFAWMAIFNFVPDLFSTVAALIMVYLSKT